MGKSKKNGSGSMGGRSGSGKGYGSVRDAVVLRPSKAAKFSSSALVKPDSKAGSMRLLRSNGCSSMEGSSGSDGDSVDGSMEEKEATGYSSDEGTWEAHLYGWKTNGEQFGSVDGMEVETLAVGKVSLSPKFVSRMKYHVDLNRAAPGGKALGSSANMNGTVHSCTIQRTRCLTECL